MSAVLLANLAATLFMTGLIWLVQLVHYPLLARVGAAQLPAYHAAHSRRITPLVLAAMTVELATSALLVADRPAGVHPLAVWAGLALAIALWVSTAVLQSPDHSRLAARGHAASVDRLVARNWARTAGWSARSALVLAMAAAAA